MPATAKTPMTWIILQGLGSPLMARAGKQLEHAGARAVRVNFSGGDWALRGKGEHINYRGTPEGLYDFYADLCKRTQAKGFLLFGDLRAVHLPAFDYALKAGLDVWVLEEGYLRPGWVTLEHMGTNARSPLPRDAAGIRTLAETIRKTPNATHITPPSFPNPMRRRVLFEIINRGANIFLAPFFPHYRTHRPYPMSTEVGSWLKRLSKRRANKRHCAQTLNRYTLERPHYYLAPLQLNGDTQILHNSNVGGITGFIDTVLASFAEHAPQNSRLLIKNHPLDNGLIPYGALIQAQATTLGIAERVDYIDGGDIAPLIRHAAGVIVINSTVGLQALLAKVPVFALGQAIYNMPGLSHQGTLSTFWQHSKQPDSALLADFELCVKTGSLIEGDFFTKDGIEVASKAIADTLLGKRFRTKQMLAATKGVGTRLLSPQSLAASKGKRIHKGRF